MNLKKILAVNASHKESEWICARIYVFETYYNKLIQQSNMVKTSNNNSNSVKIILNTVTITVSDSIVYALQKSL
jgi:hypothetical protein